MYSLPESRVLPGHLFIQCLVCGPTLLDSHLRVATAPPGYRAIIQRLIVRPLARAPLELSVRAINTVMPVVCISNMTVRLTTECKCLRLKISCWSYFNYCEPGLCCQSIPGFVFVLSSHSLFPFDWTHQNTTGSIPINRHETALTMGMRHSIADCPALSQMCKQCVFK